MKRAVPLLAVAALVAAAAAYYFLGRAPAPPPEPAQVAAGEPPPAPAPEPTIVTPPGSAVSLPGLDESDAAMDEWLFGLLGREVVERFLVRESLARKIVATVDNLPRKKVEMGVRVVRAFPGAFQPERDGAETSLGPAVYARYEPLVQVLRAVDPVRAADLYVRIYPLLQQAYEELGYPGRQFHGRLLEALDDLAAAPVIDGPVPLVQPHVFYEFADPALEARSAGQKALLRIGPQNAAVAKEKLAAFRAAIVARATVPAPGG